MSIEEQTQEMKEYMIALLDGRNIPEDALNDIVVRASRHFAKAQNDGYHEGYAAGVKAERERNVAIVKECQISGSEMADANEIITRIERTET